MLSSRSIAVVAGVALAALGILTVYVFLDLRATNDELAATQGSLVETQTRLGDTRATLEETDTALAEQTTLNADLTSENRGLELDKAAVETENATLEASLSQARRENSDLTGQNSSLSRDLQASTERASALGADLETLKSEYAALTASHRELGLNHAGLQAEHALLQEAAGTAESLAAKVEELRQEISELEAIRAPLILEPGDSWTTGFKCTGSMEPVITCLDEARWVGDFEPEDIIVGSTVSYDPGCGDDEPDGRWTSHRVMDIEIRDGVHYYWPKGDNNREADGCWISEQSIRAYIVEIYRGVRPENAELRSGVNSAQAAMDAARDVYDAERASYEELRVRFCGERPWGDCPLPDHQYNEAIAQHRILEQARVLLTQAIDHWRCWTQNARASEYPGHIPHSC